LIAYLCTGVIGFAATVVYSHFLGGSFGTTAGASGAVLGVMGIILGWMIRRRDPRWKDFAAQALFYGVLFGFVVNASSMGVMVNNSAHIGGLLSGTLFGAVYAGPRPRSDLWANLLAGVAVIACVVSLLLPHWSPLGRKTRWLSKAPVAPAPVVQRDDGATASPGRHSARPG
jgi:membrane associated rhomboid family serine protease